MGFEENFPYGFQKKLLRIGMKLFYRVVLKKYVYPNTSDISNGFVNNRSNGFDLVKNRKKK